MSQTLDQWQKRLEEHFAELASARSTTDVPLFALEHGLSEDELEEIGGLLRARVQSNLWLSAHWLAWVVYATEFGYAYEGDEYWPTFEWRTPRWKENGSRNQLRSWFTKFHKNYGGVRPSGVWAGQFPIIAWPITHAILPKYLQWQLSKTLYDLRYELAGLHTLSPESVGHLLAENAWDSSSRLRVFLQQQELTGRIVLALLGDSQEAQSPIFPPTLRRLVTDLEEVQSSREWLKETSRFVADRLQGASRGTAPGTKEPEELSRKPKERLTLGMRPNLMLRRSGPDIWSVVIDIPSFAGIAKLKADLRSFLGRTRCKIAGTGETWRPAGWLLTHNQKCLLKSWPGAGSVLMRFERENPVLDHLIDSEVRLSKGPAWLCRVADDGLAREIEGRTVRPNRKYVVLSEAPLPASSLLGNCAVDCQGLNAAVLSTPATFSAESIALLESLGLQLARTVRVWPAGLCARAWDGEGYSEWLTTESPCFGIAHDHPLEGYALRLDDGTEVFVKADGKGQPSFVTLPKLSRGAHRLSVRARQIAGRTPRLPTPLDGVIRLEVREPAAWVPGTTSHAGLTVSMEPYDTSLDDLWGEAVSLDILGPAGRQVECRMRLQGSGGKELLDEPIGVFELPVSREAWKARLAQFVSSDKRIVSFLEASTGQLTIRGEELGEYTLRLDRDLKPVRWHCRGAHGVLVLRLIDDTARDEPAIVTFRSFDRPARTAPWEGNLALSGFEVPGAGGLFEARNGEFGENLVVSTPQIKGGLQGLVIEPALSDLDSAAIVQILELIRFWSEVRLVGPLVQLRHNRIVTRLINCFFSRVCGAHWAETETACMSGSSSDSDLHELQRSVGASGFAAVLRRDYVRLQAGTRPGTEWFADVALRYRICSEKGLCEFALQLASRPQYMLSIPGPAFDSLLADVQRNNVLMRGARFVAFLAARDENESFKTGLPRWTW